MCRQTTSTHYTHAHSFRTHSIVLQMFFSNSMFGVEVFKSLFIHFNYMADVHHLLNTVLRWEYCYHPPVFYAILLHSIALIFIFSTIDSDMLLHILSVYSFFFFARRLCVFVSVCVLTFIFFVFWFSSFTLDLIFSPIFFSSFQDSVFFLYSLPLIEWL